jgi:hypothetical protein
MTGPKRHPVARRTFLAAGPAAAMAASTSEQAAPDAASPSLRRRHRPGRRKTYLLAFDKGDEALSGLLAFAKNQRLGDGDFSAIGAVSDAVLAPSTARRMTSDASTCRSCMSRPAWAWPTVRLVPGTFSRHTSGLR